MESKAKKLEKSVEDLKIQVDKIQKKIAKGKTTKLIISTIYSILLVCIILFSEADHEKVSLLLNESQRIMEGALMIAEN